MPLRKMGSRRHGRRGRGRATQETIKSPMNQVNGQAEDPPMEQPIGMLGLVMATLSMETIQALVQSAVADQMA